jgi:hypothetical protein
MPPCLTRIDSPECAESDCWDWAHCRPFGLKALGLRSASVESMRGSEDDAIRVELSTHLSGRSSGGGQKVRPPPQMAEKSCMLATNFSSIFSVSMMRICGSLFRPLCRPPWFGTEFDSGLVYVRDRFTASRKVRQETLVPSPTHAIAFLGAAAEA